MDHHLASGDTGNSPNSHSRKTVTTETGRIELEIPRGRQATFDPQSTAKYQRRFLAICPSSKWAQNPYLREQPFKRGGPLYSLRVGNYDLAGTPKTLQGEPC